MTADERRESKFNDLILTLDSYLDKEKNDYPEEELNKSLGNIKRNVSNLYSESEVDNYLQDRRDKRTEEARETVLNANPLLETRQIRNKGGLLEDDREQYGVGGLASKLAKRLLKRFGDNEKIKDSLSTIEQKENQLNKQGYTTTADEQELNNLKYMLEEELAELETYKMSRGGQDVGMDISRSQELAAEQLARKQLRKEGADEASPDILRKRMRKLLDEGKVKDSSEGIRKQKAEGGLLEDDREQYAEGEDVEMTLDDMPTDKKWEKAYNQYLSLPKDVKNKNKMAYDVAGDRYLLVPNRVKEDILQPENEINYDIISINRAVEVYSTREKKAEGGELEDQMEMMLGRTEETPMEEQMTGVMGESEEQPTMLPDEEMEEDYVDYVVGKTLSEEDNQYLMSMLEQDDRLSVIFDQVVESATEFSGEGPIEGPGTETSDSIPARLSDGEFVITAKAAEEIGVDNLMSMMKNAETSADKRQMAYEGGSIREEKEVMAAPKEPQQQNINVTKTTLDDGALLSRDQEDLVGNAVKENMMLDPYQRHVRS